MEKKKPAGFVATCQCGVIVGAMDYGRTDRKDAGQMLGKWLHEGCTVEPRFSRMWSVVVEACRCEPYPTVHDSPDEPSELGYEHEEPWCTCCDEHSIEELDTNCCDSCGKDIVMLRS